MMCNMAAPHACLVCEGSPTAICMLDQSTSWANSNPLLSKATPAPMLFKHLSLPMQMGRLWRTVWSWKRGPTC